MDVINGAEHFALFSLIEKIYNILVYLFIFFCAFELNDSHGFNFCTENSY